MILLCEIEPTKIKETFITFDFRDGRDGYSSGVAVAVVFLRLEVRVQFPR